MAGPERRISIDGALRPITIEAAYSWRKEGQIGSLAPGKIAIAIAPEKLKDIGIWGTMFEGRVFPVRRTLSAGVETSARVAFIAPRRTFRGRFRRAGDADS